MQTSKKCPEFTRACRISWMQYAEFRYHGPAAIRDDCTIVTQFRCEFCVVGMRWWKGRERCCEIVVAKRLDERAVDIHIVRIDVP